MYNVHMMHTYYWVTLASTKIWGIGSQLMLTKFEVTDIHTCTYMYLSIGLAYNTSPNILGLGTTTLLLLEGGGYSNTIQWESKTNARHAPHSKMSVL